MSARPWQPSDFAQRITDSTLDRDVVVDGIQGGGTVFETRMRQRVTDPPEPEPEPEAHRVHVYERVTSTPTPPSDPAEIRRWQRQGRLPLHTDIDLGVEIAVSLKPLSALLIGAPVKGPVGRRYLPSDLFTSHRIGEPEACVVGAVTAVAGVVAALASPRAEGRDAARVFAATRPRILVSDIPSTVWARKLAAWVATLNPQLHDALARDPHAGDDVAVALRRLDREVAVTTSRTRATLAHIEELRAGDRAYRERQAARTRAQADADRALLAELTGGTR